MQSSDAIKTQENTVRLLGRYYSALRDGVWRRRGDNLGPENIYRLTSLPGK
jgi:hypothetical protein